MEQYPQIVAWEVHARQQETIKYHASGAALGQETRGGRSPSLEVFKPWLDTAMGSLTQCWQQPSSGWEVGLETPEVPQHHPRMALIFLFLLPDLVWSSAAWCHLPYYKELGIL